jgi:hypothetical protein
MRSGSFRVGLPVGRDRHPDLSHRLCHSRTGSYRAPLSFHLHRDVAVELYARKSAPEASHYGIAHGMTAIFGAVMRR